MLKLDPDSLYSLSELEELLRGIVSLATLLERLELKERRLFRDALFGWEILEASRRAGPFSGADHAQAAAATATLRGSGGADDRRRGKREKREHQGVRKLSARDLEE